MTCSVSSLNEHPVYISFLQHRADDENLLVVKGETALSPLRRDTGKIAQNDIALVGAERP